MATEAGVVEGGGVPPVSDVEVHLLVLAEVPADVRVRAGVNDNDNDDLNDNDNDVLT